MTNTDSFFRASQLAEIARREEKKQRDIRLGKIIPRPNIIQFPDQTTKPVNREMQTQDACDPPPAPVVPLPESPEVKKRRAKTELRDLLCRVYALQEELAGVAPIDADAPTLAVRPIISTVAKHYGKTMREISSENRMQSITRPRHIAIYLAKEEGGWSFKRIASALGSRDHSTASHAYHKVRRERITDQKLDRELTELTAVLEQVRIGNA